MSFRKILPSKLRLPKSPRRVNRNGKDGEDSDIHPAIEEESKSGPAGNGTNVSQSEPLPMRRLSIPTGSSNEFPYHSPPSDSEMSLELSQASPIMLGELHERNIFTNIGIMFWINNLSISAFNKVYFFDFR